MPGHAGKPRWSAADLLGLYESEGGTIFSRSLWHKITSIGSLADERYPKEGIEGVLARYFGDTRLDQALTDVIVPSYDLEAREPWFFKSTDAKLPDKKRNYLMREAARATSAAPTYFEPYHLQSLDDEVDHRTLVDGGVFANNPAMCAWAEASGGGQPADARLLSLGTGELCRRMPFSEVHDWGLVRVGAADPQRRHGRRQRRHQLPAARDARPRLLPAPDARARGRQRRHGRRRKDKPPRA